jgi:mannitol-1-phosphate 5-dehydrogenase
VKRTFVGFGFGPIQGGLFAYEAFRSGNFGRLVVAEILPDVVEAVRRGGGRYRINVATRSGVEVREVAGVEIFNPRDRSDAARLAQAVAEASELATALPSVAVYGNGATSAAGLLAQGLARKLADASLPDAVVYAAENHNHAAELLEQAVRDRMPRADPPLDPRVCFLNTVIGKMSGVVADPAQIRADGLAPLVDGWERAFRLEEFNRILVSEPRLPGFQRGIEVFIEKPDLLPFEEAKLYGHNAVHALIGYLADRKGYAFMSEVISDPGLLRAAREAFLEESGRALLRRHAGKDPLFTPAGYRVYADDLLERMTNPHLRDRVERIIRDPRRKLGWDDRLVGTMRIALDAGVTPRRFALGAAAAVERLAAESGDVPRKQILEEIWREHDDAPTGRKQQLQALILEAGERLV